jgi:hypothetical protein
MWEYLASVLHLYPFRCQLCTARFRAFQGRHYSRHTDRREYDRLLVRIPVVISAGSSQTEGETVDLSLTGCSLRTEAAPAVGSTVQLRLRLGRAGDVTIHGALVKSQREGGGMGVHFTQVAKPEHERLSKYLARFLRPSGTTRRGTGRPRPELVMAAVVGLGIILVVPLLMGRIGTSSLR